MKVTFPVEVKISLLPEFARGKCTSVTMLQTLALSTGFCTAALATLHLKFGVRLRSSALKSLAEDMANIITTTDSNGNETKEDYEIAAVTLPSRFSVLCQNTWKVGQLFVC